MKSLSDVKFSTLDLVPVRANGSPAQSLRNSLDLAQHVEKFGYNRFWVAEHHNMDGIASSATSVLLGYLAGGTSTIRVGSGGVMLPNHAPLVIAEQFGTLESLYPGRIDLGLGRAPGSDQMTARALRRERSGSADDFPARRGRTDGLLGPTHAGPTGDRRTRHRHQRAGLAAAVPACSAHSWQANAVCPTPSPRISHRV